MTPKHFLETVLPDDYGDGEYSYCIFSLQHTGEKKSISNQYWASSIAEAAKIADGKAAGSHTSGKAVDVACERGFAYQVLFAAVKLGFTGIGVQQSGSRRFLHLDTVGVEDNFHVPRPALWSY